MGVLDDAIRQHIELKRQHGASEDDLRLQEQEALGPARRESPAPAADEQAEAPAEEAFDSQSTTVLPAADDLPDPEAFHEAPGPVEPEPFSTDDPFAGDEPFVEPQPPQEAADDEDVLEETPEFLQETPEHDRLWFEQKPPRDFDFDDK